MATTTNLTTSYVGEFAGEYIGKALLMANSLSNGVVTVKPNILGTRIVKTLAIGSGLVQDATCDFTDTSSVTIDERTLTPKLLQINLEMCKQDFVDDYEVANMGGSAWKNFPSNVSDFVIARALATGMAKTETDIWQGVDGAGAFDGFETLFLADGNVIDVATPVAITAANVIDELGRTLDATPEQVRQQPDFNIAVAPNVFYAYIRSLGGFGASGLGANGVNNAGTTWFNGGDRIVFEDTVVIKCNGLSNGSMVATYAGNLWFGTALLADHNRLAILDMVDHDLSDNIRFRASWSSGVQYGFGGDVVYYAGV